ncbi:NAD(P)H-dependent oxidoreductase [Clostridium estertheticum]|uniref:flavodoxin n=1 Tax=Clostridium estertheticum TaxID=238834 RepID=UPI001C0C5C5D|nr:flavodoxin [Clostridium estertheticum]MBU3201101.1 NAD(P)H-dependent oxidoreductase [Clostridium estertheticum]WAG66593.1 NAD(P)H-dependent oxidoreductase [Clostridium estertheticum]
MANILTVYFSLKGQTIAPGMKIVNLKKGNTAVVAEYIQKAVGGDLFEIETVKTYIKDHMKMIYEAKEEQKKGIRPELRVFPDSIEEYDTVFVGTPNWWNELPMPVVAFLEHFDWKGKKISPFVTSEGSGVGSMVDQIRKICQGAEIKEALSIRGSEAEVSESRIDSWTKIKI